jgi:hypothetical protein
MDISRNEVIRAFDFTSFASALHTVLVAKILYSQIPRIDFCMSVTRTEAVILGWEAP